MGRKIIALSIAGMMASPYSWAWGSSGHEIIARIAAARLSPTASQRVLSLLGGKELAEAMAMASTWPDEINRTATGTAGWHFMDVPLDVRIDTRLDFATYCPNNDCLTKHIDDFARQLTSRATFNPSTQRPSYAQQQSRGTSGTPASWTPAQQLSFLIHFIGDVHQPLHAATNGDLGGNCVRLVLSKEGPYAANLHSFWDQTVVAYLMHGRTEAQTAKELAVSKVDAKLSGTPLEWAAESHEVAILLYNELNLNHLLAQAGCAKDIKPLQLPDKYADSAAKRASDQLLKAGLRLAEELNTLFSGPRQ